jgi:SMC interacting uncharacterized protein involved in chromosome segregation
VDETFFDWFVTDKQETPSLQEMSKEKPNPLKLVNEIVIGIYTQISGLEHELSAVVNMQQRSMTVSDSSLSK